MDVSPVSGMSSFGGLSSNEATPLTRQEQEQFASIVKDPENRGFYPWLRSFINRLLGVFGEKLSPGQLNRCLDNIFSNENEWQHKGSFEVGGVFQTLFREKQFAGNTYVVCAATHDLQESESDSIAAHMSGGRSLIQTFAALDGAYPEGSVKALIPIAQSNTYGPFGARGHFTLLEVDIDNGMIKNAVLHDSKGGFVDTFYDGAGRLTEILHKANLVGDDSFSVAVEHRGEQSLLNGNDCGRFAAYYAAKIITDENLTNANKKDAGAFFKEHF